MTESLSEVQSVLGITVTMTMKIKVRNLQEKLKISGEDKYTTFHFHDS